MQTKVEIVAQGIRYQIEKHPDSTEWQPAYTLSGPRGAKYYLIRNGPNPTMLFAINAKAFTRGTPFEGSWFRDGGPGNDKPLRF